MGAITNRARKEWLRLYPRIRNTEIVCSPAECAPNCRDPQCPYLHGAVWHVGRRSFGTEAEALAYAKRHRTA